MVTILANFCMVFNKCVTATVGSFVRNVVVLINVVTMVFTILGAGNNFVGSARLLTRGDN